MVIGYDNIWGIFSLLLFCSSFFKYVFYFLFSVIGLQFSGCSRLTLVEFSFLMD